MNRLDKTTEKNIDKLKRKLDKEKEIKLKNRAERKAILKKKRYQKKTKAKDVIMIKSIYDVPLTKSEVIAIKRVLMDFIKKNPFFKNKLTFDKTDSTQKYMFNLYRDVFKAYNKLNNNDENKSIYQIKLV